MIATASLSATLEPARSQPTRSLYRNTEEEYELALIGPPYQRIEYQAGWPALEARVRGSGWLLGVHLDHPVGNYARLEDTVRNLRSRSPTTPIVLLVELGIEESLFVSARAARSGVRAIVSPGPSMGDALRKAFTHATSLSDELVEWLELYGVRTSPLVSSLISRIVSLAPSHDTLGELLAEVGVPETSARFRMNKKRLPAPSRWYQAARALHAAIRIQAEPDTCLLRLAHLLGYADHSALSQLVNRAFGVRPGAIRGTLGWEWLMARWLARQGIAPPLQHLSPIRSNRQEQFPRLIAAPASRAC